MTHNFPFAEHPVHKNPIDIYGALYDYLVKYTAPPMEPERYFRGNQNRVVIPMDDDFCTFHIMGMNRIGTNRSQFDASKAQRDEDGTQSESVLQQVDIQVDFYSKDDETAYQRAAGHHILFRSGIPTAFLKQYGLSAAYADDIRHIDNVVETNQYLDRWTITVHLQFWSTLDLEYPWFDSFNLIPKPLF